MVCNSTSLYRIFVESVSGSSCVDFSLDSVSKFWQPAVLNSVHLYRQTPMWPGGIFG